MTNFHYQNTGNLFDALVIASHYYVQKFLVEMFNRPGTIFLENGFDAFFTSFAEFLGSIRQRIDHSDDEIENEPKPLRLNQLYLFLMIYWIQTIIAIATFITEIIVHRRQSEWERYFHDV